MLLKKASLVIACASLVQIAWAEDPYFIQLPFAPNSTDNAIAMAVSGDGRYIAGMDQTYANPNGELVRWSNPGPGGATVEVLGWPDWGTYGMRPMGISDDGAVIAVDAMNASAQHVGTRWADPSTGGPGFTDIGFLPGPYDRELTFVSGLSADGRLIVGTSGTVDIDTHQFDLDPFRWEVTDETTGEGEMVALPLLDGAEDGSANDITPDGRVIVGAAGWKTPDLRAVMWIDGQVAALGELEPGGISTAMAVSPDGTFIVGLAGLESGLDTAFIWTAEQGMRALAHLGQDEYSSVRDVTDSGLVVGISWGGALVWPDGDVPVYLADWLGTEFGLDTTGWFLRTPHAISADGRTTVGEGAFGNSATVPWLAYLGEACPADITGDGLVNTQDFIAFLNAWAGGDPVADWNEDGTINTQDFIAYLNDWAAGC